MATLASGRSMAKLATLETTRSGSLPVAELAVELLAFAGGRLAGDERRAQLLGDASSWSRYWPMTRTWSSRCLSTSWCMHRRAWPGSRRRCGTCWRPRPRRTPCAAPGQGHADLVALGRGDPALLLEDLPGHVVLLGPDQGEDVALAAVLAHQRGRQAQAAPGLDVGGDAEDRRRQQVDLVVDDQAPVLVVEQAQVGELADLAGLLVTRKGRQVRTW